VWDALYVPDSDAEAAGFDRLRLTPVPLVPEVRLLLAEDPTVLWARLEADAGRALPAPFWATAWLGGQALARYLLDRPATVAGRRVLDIGSGSGLVAIAAATAGAAVVTANDVDPYAMLAISANAHANRVDLVRSSTDLLDGDGGDVEVVLAGDALYSRAVAARMLPFLARLAARGARVLVGDPDRGHLPEDWLEPVATYQVLASGAPEDAQRSLASVLTARRRPGRSWVGPGPWASQPASGNIPIRPR
jgi:predicted nicotinamide N-methyase